MMQHFGYLVLLAYICLSQDFILGQANTADPSTKPSPGTIVAENIDQHLIAAGQNMYQGVTAVGDPLLKFAVDTAPDLAHLYAMLNGYNIPPDIAAAGKIIYGNVAVGGGHALGGAAVLGSSILGQSMQVGGHILQAQNNILETGATTGIDLSGKFADHVADATVLGGTVAGDGLTSLGDGLLVAASGANVVSQGTSQVLDAIAARLALTLSSAQKTAESLIDGGVKLLENGVIGFESKVQEEVYNSLSLYLKTLLSLQTMLENTLSIIVQSTPITGYDTSLAIPTTSA